MSEFLAVGDGEGVWRSATMVGRSGFMIAKMRAPKLYFN